MPPTIDFATLSLQDALDLAILIEEEAKERYDEFADQLTIHHTPDAAQFFVSMAGNEAKHGADLQMRRHAMFGDTPRRVSRAMLWDVEAPEYDQSRMFMSARQAMDVALDCEVKAHDFFADALAYVRDPDVRALFEELRAEELEHQELVKSVRARLPESDDDADPNVFADEPVAQ
ncbi:MAG: ferritin family protein [Acidobacteriota bacterium]